MGTDMDIKQLFDAKSKRAVYARYGTQLKPWVIMLTVAVVGLLVGGVALLFVGLSVGWLLIGVSAIPAMIAQWYNYELKNVPIDMKRNTIDARMDSNLLGMLTAKPTPKEIALALTRINGGNFFDVRFGIGGGFLKEVATDSYEDTARIFEEALRIADSHEEIGGRVSPGVVILAMFRQIPARDTILGHLQLDEEDIIRGIRWYHHLDDLVKWHANKPKQAGGLGRDWSFGWIPTLSRFGSPLGEQGSVAHTTFREPVLEQMLSMLSAKSGTIALVGRDGVGKTEIVRSLAMRLMQPDAKVPKALHFQQIFMLDASRLLSAAPGRGELENLVSIVLSEAFTAKNIIICFDNAELFFEEGVGSVDLSAVLLPIIEARRLPMILTIDEQKFLQMSKRAPALANALNRVIVQPSNEFETIMALEDQLPYLEYRRKVTYMYQSLKEAYRLGQRYIYDVSMPGQAVTLLERAADYAENGLVTAKSVATAIEQTTGVKAGAADDADEREKLLNMESLIHERMIGQERAVGVISDAMRRARSGVRNQKRPVGTFLFLGPTGVGKTELAKSLASVYFGGEDNIIRLDMNEFVSEQDVARLIADGADDQGSLTAQVMRQPFSVVLLDEIEKAHSSVLTTLLQLLDEGILRDVRGREISFRDTVVIATSNAGADRIQEYIHRGYKLEQFEQTFINELIGGHLFHPEFLNRFDEIVVFEPLNKPQLLQVLDLILVGVNKNLAGQKITVSITPDAKEYLVEMGYDPRLGARPMRRVVQRAVESTVAKMLLSNEVRPGETIEITREQAEAVLGRVQLSDAPDVTRSL